MKTRFLAILILISLGVQGQTDYLDWLKFNTVTEQTDFTGNYNLLPLMRSSGRMNGSFIHSDSLVLKSNLGNYALLDSDNVFSGRQYIENESLVTISTLGDQYNKTSVAGSSIHTENSVNGTSIYRSSFLNPEKLVFENTSEIGVFSSTILKPTNNNNNNTVYLPEESGVMALIEDVNITTDVEGDFEVVAGVIKNIGGTWEFIEDSTHLGKMGLDSIVTYSDHARVYFDKSYSKVVAVTATPDESYTQKGIGVGASVDIDYFRVYLTQTKPLGDYIYYNGTDWISFRGVFSGITYNNGILNIPHDFVYDNFDISLTPRDSCPYNLRVSSPSSSSVSVSFFDITGGQYTGSPTTDMRIFVSRGGTGQLTNITSEFPTANIWIYGIMQK